MLYSGIDLHKRDLVVSTVDPSGVAVQDAKLPTSRGWIEHELAPQLVPTADIQRLLYIPGIGKIVAFTLLLEIDDIARFATPRDFVSYCRLVPAAKNSGGKTRQQRSKDGNRYLKIAFHHAALGEPACLTGDVSSHRGAQLRLP